jgi:hypothetical protein
MKRSAVVIGIVVLCLSCSIWAADQKVDFSGTWKQDMKLSDAAPKSTGGGGMMGGMGGGMGGMGGGMGGGGMMGGGMGGMGGGMGGMGGGMGRGGAQRNLTLKIQQTDTEITIATVGVGQNGADVSETFKLDGSVKKELVTEAGFMGAPGTQVKQETKAKLSGSKLTVTQKKKSNTNPSTVKKEFSLSKDGKVLTFKYSTSSTYSGSTQKIVYNKE